jgi:anaerobic selenocysteine-containing dehydrogenase
VSQHPNTPGRPSPWELAVGPPPEAWDDWTEFDGRAWPERKETHYRCIPTICFNCESGCGLLAFVDKATGDIRKFEGNPVHPGSRGRTCAKGPATINQVNDPERILQPLKRVGDRGEGRFEPVSWEAALADIGGRIRKAIDEDRRDEVMYHVGRPGDDHFVARMLSAWGVDGHNSHTNVCSASARTGLALWCGSDRPSPDYAGTKFILLLSAHLETGHYFNPHAQRIIDAKSAGARIAVVDTRLSNTATHADHWISTWPGSEAALLLGIAHRLLVTNRIDHAFVRAWTNWAAYLEAHDPDGPGTFERFLEHLTERYAAFTPAFVAEECRIPAETVDVLADEIAAAEGKFASHLWRGAASGNLGGWQIMRALALLHVLTGSFGRPGGLNPNSWDKVVPKPSDMPPPITRWNEVIWPRQYPLAHYEMSFLLPHLLRDQAKRIDVYFTRVYNPVWTNPDGCSWIRMLEDEDRLGCHVALTPIWSETAQWADYVLPTGLGPERHDLMSQETHAGTWIGFRQPVGREFRRLEGKAPDSTLGTNPGEVWEEAEFWIALTWKIDPDGSLGIRRYYESKASPGEPIGLDEYYADIFEHAVPGLPDAAAAQDLTPLEYMRRHGAFDVPYAGQERYAKEGKSAAKGGDADTGGRVGFPTPSGKLEIHSTTLAEWGHADQAVPGYIRSHVHWRELDLAAGERVLLPTFRLPTLIHTRSGNAKWLQEISHTNPLWMHPEDAEIFGLENGALARVRTQIGYFVPRVWITEGIHPGVVACSHHVGRWRLHRAVGGERLSTALVELRREDGRFLFRQTEGVGPFPSKDADTERIWWHETGVNQNLTFPVQPDPVSGMHCWHQQVKIAPAQADDRYGDVFVDTARSLAVYEAWLEKARPAPGPGGLRRPLWLNRPLHPTPDAYRLGDA